MSTTLQPDEDSSTRTMTSRNVTEHVDLDDVWRRLGTFGRYQIVQATLLMISVIPEVVQLLVVVFIGFRPDYICANVSSSKIIEDTTKYSNTSLDLSYHACHVDLVISDTNTTLLSLSPCPAGYNYGVEKDRTFVTEYDLVCNGAERAELSQTLLIVGQIFGAAILSQCSDRFGRKFVIVSSNIGLLAAGLGGCFLPTFTGFAIMRFLIGVFQQGLAMARPALMLEMFPEEARYLTEIAGLFTWTFGTVIMMPVVYFLRDISWRYLYLVITLTSAYSVVGYWTVDSLTYYGLILSSASLPLDRYLNFFLLAVAEFPVAFFEYTLMNRIGRKKFCIIFHVIAAVSLIAGTTANYFSESPGAKIVIMIFFFLGKLGITGSFSCLFLYTPEIYPTNLRMVGMGLPSAVGRVGSMLAPFAGPLAERIKWAPGAIFGVLCVVVVLVFPLLPETRGHELPTRVEDLEEWYKAGSGTTRQK